MKKDKHGNTWADYLMETMILFVGLCAFLYICALMGVMG